MKNKLVRITVLITALFMVMESPLTVLASYAEEGDVVTEVTVDEADTYEDGNQMNESIPDSEVETEIENLKSSRGRPRSVTASFEFLTGYQYDSIWLGDYKGIGLRWEVTKNYGDSIGMITNSLVGTPKIYPDTDAQGWSDSSLRSWLNNYEEDFDGLNTRANPYDDSFIDHFVAPELNAFLETEVVNDDAYVLLPFSQERYSLAGPNTMDKFYIPDYYEVTRGTSGLDPKKVNFGTSWSTRTLVDLGKTAWVMYAIHNGTITSYPKGAALGIRPMCRLDLNSVAFLTDSGMQDPKGMVPVRETSNTSWNITLFDESQHFTADTDNVVKTEQRKLRIPSNYQYEEGASGTDAYNVAGMVTEGEYGQGIVKNYGIVGRIVNGYAELILPEDYNYETDKLYLMSKTYARGITEFVSYPVEIPIPATEVIFNSNGGMGTMENQIINAGEVTLLKDCKFSRPGYTMSGWNTKADGTGRSYRNPEIMRDDNMPENNLILYAQWIPENYLVHFDPAGGTGHFPDKTVKFDENDLIPSYEPSKEGYTFEHWQTENGGIIDQNVPYNELVNGDTAVKEITLYASYKSNTYEVIYDPNGEDVAGTMQRQNMVYDVSQKLLKNGYTRQGYTFAGWTLDPKRGVQYMDEEEVLNLGREADAVITLYAVWNKSGDSPYKVEHYKQKDDGKWTSVPDETEEKSGEAGTTVTAIPRDYEGYMFDASVEDGILKGEISSSGNLVLKLYYKQLHSVSFDSQGGGDNPPTQKIPYGKTAAEPDPVLRQGYTFEGWYHTESRKKWDFENPVTKDICLKAEWIPVQYEVAFDKNSDKAVGQMENKKATYDEEITLTRNAFTFEDHEFAGWSEVPDGAVSYTDGQSVKNLTAEKDGKVILYAVWNAKGDTKYTVEHYKQNKDGSWPEEASESEIITGKIDTLVSGQAKNYKGYVFDASAEGSVVSGTVQADGGLTLKLYYKISHTVSFDSDGGDYTPHDQAVAHGDQAVRPDNPAKKGYVFAGWFYKDSGGAEREWDFNDAVTNDMELAAHWKIASASITSTPPANAPVSSFSPRTSSGVSYNQPGSVQPGRSSTVTKPVKTGDDTNLKLLIGIFAGAGLLIIVLITRKKRKL